MKQYLFIASFLSTASNPILYRNPFQPGHPPSHPSSVPSIHLFFSRLLESIPEKEPRFRSINTHIVIHPAKRTRSVSLYLSLFSP